MPERVRSYRELIVWQKAMAFVTLCYRLSQSFPSDERFGLTSQLRRAAVSIPANIAEGQGRATSADFKRHLTIAYGSLMEVETHVLIAQDLGYASVEECAQTLDKAGEVGRLLNALRRSLPEARNRSRDELPDH
ncbi:MAG: four helix bundle protein [Planctomycetaceae bacterium]|nr:four helix bundle protein [Planctomycetaceae bacterium]